MENEQIMINANYELADGIDRGAPAEQVPELVVDTTTVLPDNLAELLLADQPEARVDTTTVLPDNLAELLTRSEELVIQARPREFLPVNLAEKLLAGETTPVSPSNKLIATPANNPDEGSMSYWKSEIEAASNRSRRPLSGSEFKKVVNAIENCSRGADIEKANAREIAGLLAKIHGPSGESLFKDPELRNAYKSAITTDRSTQQKAQDDLTVTHAHLSQFGDDKSQNNTVVVRQPSRMR